MIVDSGFILNEPLWSMPIISLSFMTLNSHFTFVDLSFFSCQMSLSPCEAAVGVNAYLLQRISSEDKDCKGTKVWGGGD